MGLIDLRSDTVTLPTQRMREAICGAELGDDVFQEDPTVNRLQEIAAERLGKEAGLLVPSGTMGNLVSVLTHCSRGEEVILGDKSHIFLSEGGGISMVGGIYPRTLCNQPDGTMRLEEIEAAIRPDNIHFPRTRLICLENTHNRCFGAPLRPDYCNSVAALAKTRGLRVHLDGARIFNASVALRLDVKELASCADSVLFCFSKGLSAPVGSVICGSTDFIEEARRIRKTLGGAMRQAGIIAAAGIVALDEMVERLQEDHINARRLAEALAEIKGLSIDPTRVRTNILYFELEASRPAPDELIERASEKGLKFLRTGPSSFRMVTHYGITAPMIDSAVAIMREVMHSR